MTPEDQAYYHPYFKLEQEGAHYRVLDGEQPVMEFRNHDMFMGGIFIMGGITFRPGGPRRICNMIPFWEGFIPARREVKVSVLEGQNSDRLHLLIQPDDEGGLAAVHGEITFTWDAELGSYAIEVQGRLELRQPLSEDCPGGLYPMPVAGGGTAWVWQMDDPNYENNYGPAVPMLQDWYNQGEPNTGVDTFRQNWSRAVTHLLSEDEEGTLRTIAAHRGRLFAQPLNLQLFPVKPSGRTGALLKDGSAVIYQMLTDQPVSSHICEWGFDHHYYHTLPTVDLPAGHVLECHFRMTEWSPRAIQPLLALAVPLEPAPELLARLEVPIYEEPVCEFHTSWIDEKAADAFPWSPGRGASWDREVGHQKAGSLRLDQDSIAGQAAEWRVTDVGPSDFMNPLVPGSRYRFSAWVRLEDVPDCPRPYATLAVGFKYYKGPGTYSVPVPVEFTLSTPVRTRDEWVQISVDTPPVDGYAGGTTLVCRLEGVGTAWFDEVRFERLP
ncbi:MAG TPA: hypothetical protein VGM19_05155 [Armatimonadota bacterium]